MTSLSDAPEEAVVVDDPPAPPVKRRGRPPGSKTKKTAVKRAAHRARPVDIDAVHAKPKKPVGRPRKAPEPSSEIHPSFQPLADVLSAAYLQCAMGKGRERHGGAIPLYEQPWLQIARASGPGFLTGQATKKIMEAAKMRASSRYERGAYERELLGAMVYSAFAILFERKGVGGAD